MSKKFEKLEEVKKYWNFFTENSFGTYRFLSLKKTIDTPFFKLAHFSGVFRKTAFKYFFLDFQWKIEKNYFWNKFSCSGFYTDN